MPEALIRPELVQLGAAPADKTAAIRQAGQLLVAAGCIAPAYVQSLLARAEFVLQGGLDTLRLGRLLIHALGIDKP